MLRWSEIESDPRYRSLSFDKQNQLKNNWVRQSMIPEVVNLGASRQQQMELIREFSKPSVRFEDENTQRGVEELAKRFNAGDPEARKGMESIVLDATAKNASLLYSLGSRLFNEGQEEMRGAEDETEVVKAYQLYNNPEARKVVAYADYLLETTDEGRAGIRAKKAAVGIGLSIAEWAAMAIPITGLSLGTAKGIGTLAPKMVKLISEGKKFGLASKVVGEIAGQVTHAAMTGALMTAKDMVLDEVNENLIEDPVTQDRFMKAAKYFGNNFLWDTIANVGLDYVAPQVKGILKMHSWSKGLSEEAVKVLKGADTTAARRELARDAISGKEIPDELLRRIPEKDQVKIVSNMISMKTMEMVPDLTEKERLIFLAKRNGISLAEVDDGWKMVDEGEVLRKFRDIGEVEGYLAGRVKSYSRGELKKMTAAVAENEGFGGLKADLVGVGKVEIKNISTPTLVASVLRGGEEKGARVAGYALLRKANIPELSAEKFRVIRKEGLFQVVYDNKVYDEIPISGLSPASLRKGLVGIATDLKGDLKSLNRQITAVAADWGKWVDRDMLLKGVRLEDIAANLGAKVRREADGLGVTVVKGKEEFFGATEKIAQDRFLNSLVSKEDLGIYLRREHGIGLRSKEGVYQVVDDGVVTAEGRSIGQILDAHPEFIPKLPGKVSPQWNIVDDEVAEVTLMKGGAVGGYQALLKNLSVYENYTLTEKKMYYDVLGAGMKKGKIAVEEKTNKIRISFAPTGDEQVFDSVKEAREFVTGGYLEFGNLVRTAQKKGYNLDLLADGSYVLKGGKNPVVIRTEAELLQKLREVPIPTWVRELSGVDENVLKEVVDGDTESYLGKINDYFIRTDPKGIPSYPLKTKASYIFQPVRASLESIVKAGGDPAILKQFDDFELLRAGMEGALRKGKDLLPVAFTLPGGKVMDGMKRVGLGKYIRMKTDAGRLKIKELFKLDEADLSVVDQLRGVYGTDEFNGLFRKFGVDPEKYLEDYLPKIRDWFEAEKLGMKIPTDGGVQAVLKKSFGGRVPTELDAFFKHTRVQELLDIALEEDPLKQLQYYMAVGYREKYLGDQMKGMMEYWFKSKDVLAKQRMFTYLGDVMNISATYQQELLKQMGEDFSKKFTHGTNYFKWLESSCYLGTMGWRPWMAIRNTHQIWSTLAPLVGNGRVRTALKTMDDKGKEVYSMLVRKGIITETLPTAGHDILSETPTLNKLAKSGLGWYKDADSLTRGVAWLSASDSLDSAIKRFGKDAMDIRSEGFLRESRISILPKKLQTEALNALMKDDVEVARDVIGRYVVETTMFPYRSGMSNTMYRGTIGKMFGRMGHYPLYYVDGVRRALSSMPASEKVAYAALWAGNMTAMYYGYKKLLGSENPQFLFWNPMIFTGGPFYDMMEDVRQIASGGPLTKQKLHSLVGIGRTGFNPLNSSAFKVAMPGGYQLKKMMAAVEEFQKGNYWGAAANALSMPYTPGEAVWE